MTLLSQNACPFSAPDEPHLRRTRFHQWGNLIQRWIWEPTDQAWRLATEQTREEWDARVAELHAEREKHPITDADLRRGAELAREHGWD